jgi:hypothetical protein
MVSASAGMGVTAATGVNAVLVAEAVAAAVARHGGAVARSQRRQGRTCIAGRGSRIAGRGSRIAGRRSRARG